MKKTLNITIAIIVVLSFISFTMADSEEDFSQAQALINQSISCDELTDEQLELIGDYYMEQMHPGEAHEYMDQMMGGEDSESLRQVHINMARNIYCGENTSYRYGMMGGMMGYNYPAYNNFRIYTLFLPIIFVLIMVLLIILIFKQIGRR
ncbi:MAG TPA: hypothetical protein VJ142_00530 [Candidatus Nanoarchaeia archaeon]|nr:hypothetical protein [Candidatus Nanoarchaeia archaeon]